MRPEEASLSGLVRRECHRARFFADVEVVRGSERFRTRISDITQDGLLIETTEPFEPGTEFHARLRKLVDGLPLKGGLARLILGGQVSASAKQELHYGCGLSARR